MEVPKMSRKSNLVIFLPDQQRADSMKCYGNNWVQTPNLDKLAEQSVIFEHCYVTQPICTPARSSILTGLYPHTTGCTQNNIPLKPDEKTIAEMVSDDYVCGYFGKWHLGDEVIAQHGFKHWVSIEDSYRAHYSKEEYLSVLSSYHHYLVKNGFEPDVEYYGAKVFGRYTVANFEERFTKAHFVAQEAAKFIKQNKNHPFIIFVAPLEPHSPYTGPFNDLYNPDEIPNSPVFLRPPDESTSMLKRAYAYFYGHCGEHKGFNLKEEAEWKRLKAQYYGNVTLVDRSVGIVLNALEEAEILDNTVVVFTSDHGELAGDHQMIGKDVLWEEAIKVPLLIRIPKIGKRFIKGRISQIDLLPTLLALIGQPIPEHLQGKNRLDVIEGKTTLDDNYIIVERNESDVEEMIRSSNPPFLPKDRKVDIDWRGVITSSGWKLNVSADDLPELYNLQTDPYEQCNLIHEPDMQEIKERLYRYLLTWQEKTEDTCTNLSVQKQEIS